MPLEWLKAVQTAFREKLVYGAHFRVVLLAQIVTCHPARDT